MNVDPVIRRTIRITSATMITPHTAVVNRQPSPL